MSADLFVARATSTADRAGSCQCAHPYHTPRRPGLGTIGHVYGMAVATLQDIETAVGMVPLCLTCRSAHHMCDGVDPESETGS